jgi:hypothetical protein
MITSIGSCSSNVLINLPRAGILHRFVAVMEAIFDIVGAQ